MEVKDEWLKPCEGLDPALPKNSTGDLLLDYSNVAAVAATCMARHLTLIEYIGPVVAKEKARVLETTKK